MVHIRMLRGRGGQEIPELVSGHLDAWEEAMSNVKVGEVAGFLGGENKGNSERKLLRRGWGSRRGNLSL